MNLEIGTASFLGLCQRVSCCVNTRLDFKVRLFVLGMICGILCFMLGVLLVVSFFIPITPIFCSSILFSAVAALVFYALAFLQGLILKERLFIEPTSVLNKQLAEQKNCLGLLLSDIEDLDCQIVEHSSTISYIINTNLMETEIDGEYLDDKVRFLSLIYADLEERSAIMSRGLCLLSEEFHITYPIQRKSGLKAQFLEIKNDLLFLEKEHALGKDALIRSGRMLATAMDFLRVLYDNRYLRNKGTEDRKLLSRLQIYSPGTRFSEEIEYLSDISIRSGAEILVIRDCLTCVKSKIQDYVKVKSLVQESLRNYRIKITRAKKVLREEKTFSEKVLGEAMISSEVALECRVCLWESIVDSGEFCLQRMIKMVSLHIRYRIYLERLLEMKQEVKSVTDLRLESCQYRRLLNLSAVMEEGAVEDWWSEERIKLYRRVQTDLGWKNFRDYARQQLPVTDVAIEEVRSTLSMIKSNVQKTSSMYKEQALALTSVLDKLARESKDLMEMKKIQTEIEHIENGTIESLLPLSKGRITPVISLMQSWECLIALIEEDKNKGA